MLVLSHQDLLPAYVRAHDLDKPVDRLDRFGKRGDFLNAETPHGIAILNEPSYALADFPLAGFAPH